MKFYAITNVGKVRPINEDSFYLPGEGESFCAVADGMGGHNAGEVASAMAVEEFAKRMRLLDRVTIPAMHAAVERANEAVYEAAGQNEGMSGMGTTFSALAIEGENAIIAHVGDSRIYLVRHGAIMQITTDHTLVEEMVQQGVLTLREARVHPQRNIITRALGTEPRVEIDMLQMELLPGDVFFLCSDGMSNCIASRDILRAARAGGDWQYALERLCDMALENGGSDNITGLFAVADEEGI